MVYRSFVTLTAMGGLAALLGGCATVTRGTTSQVQFESEPSGAAVSTSLNHQCVTPCTVTVNRKDEFTVSFRKEGYKDQDVFVKTIVAPAGMAGVAGNVLIGGVVGAGVDVATGASLMHSPNPVKVVLDRLGPEPKPPKASPKNTKGKAKAKAAPAPVVEEAPAAPETEG